jgi:hypothetical protein
MWSQWKETRQRSRANWLAQQAQKLRSTGRHEEALLIASGDNAGGDELLDLARILRPQTGQVVDERNEL